MGAVFFYHLTRSSLAETAPMLLEKARNNGWAIELRGTNETALEALDKALWLGPPERFLPHGRRVNGAQDLDQPILLTLDSEPPLSPARDAIISVHGAAISADEVEVAQRVMILFDGHEGAAVATARQQWKSLTDAGCTAQYWSQESGGWEKKAEK